MLKAKIRKSATTVIGSFPSLKNQKVISYKNTLVRDSLYYFEFDQLVHSYETDPFATAMTLDDGIVHEYIPTIRAIQNNLPVIIEVDFAEHLKTQRGIWQIQMAKRWANENHSALEIYTEREIRKMPRLDNLKIFYRYSRLNLPAQYLMTVQRMLKQKTQMSLGEMAAKLIPSEPATAKPFIWASIFHHYLEVDLNEKMSDSVLLVPTERMLAWEE